MLRRTNFLFLALLFACTSSSAAQKAQKSGLPQKVLSAKSVYFEDKTLSPGTGREALVELAKWGRFKIVNNPKEADLILLLSSDPYKAGGVVFSGGQTGAIDKNGNIQEDPVPTFNKQAPVRYAYLTVIDPATGRALWSDEHQWGGLLTGSDSAGARLIKKFKKQIEK
jgi:hypothetical protein